MNSIVERLHDDLGGGPNAWLKREAADLIESLQARVKELEAKSNTLESAAGLLAESAEDLRNKLAAATKRIAELEALSVTRILVRVVPGDDGMGEEIYAKSVKEVEQMLTSLSENGEALKDQLAALRQKIEDAPVVAWQDETGFISACSGGGYFRELIRKEDLK